MGASGRERESPKFVAQCTSSFIRLTIVPATGWLPKIKSSTICSAKMPPHTHVGCKAGLRPHWLLSVCLCDCVCLCVCGKKKKKERVSNANGHAQQRPAAHTEAIRQPGQGPAAAVAGAGAGAGDPMANECQLDPDKVFAACQSFLVRPQILAARQP